AGGTPSDAPAGRSGSPPAAARLGLGRWRAAVAGRPVCPAGGGTGRNAHRHRHRTDRCPLLYLSADAESWLMLQAQDVSVSRGGRRVLCNVSAALQAGEVLGVMGPIAAGKSSLLGVLNGELAPSSGEVLLVARPLANWPGRPRAQRLAVLPQSSCLNFG